MQNDIVKTLATHRKSSRLFRTETPPIKDIIYALETARQAPSGSNMQPTSFIFIDNSNVKAKVRLASEKGEKRFYDGLVEDRKRWYMEKELSWHKPNLEEAPFLIAVVADSSKPNFFASAWVSVAFILLALEEKNLSTVTYTPSNPSLVAEALGLPKIQQVITILPIGYDADPKLKEPRKPLKEIIKYNDFDTPFIE
jgi:iodotyrosine deiodinase